MKYTWEPSDIISGTKYCDQNNNEYAIVIANFNDGMGNVFGRMNQKSFFVDTFCKSDVLADFLNKWGAKPI